QVVVALGRTPVSEGGPPAGEGLPGGAAEIEDGKAQVVVAIGGAGTAGDSQAASGGAATARAGSNGVALALGGRGADSRGRRLPNGGIVFSGAGQGGPAEARSPVAGFAFPGTSGAMSHPDGTLFQPERPGELPKVAEEAWRRARALAAAAG
ncbi:MAG: hypothetical protein L0216_13465, partial [Planctomycetales bacterium]|nr:hypothetical protein [Planctomycetales bacterium]